MTMIECGGRWRWIKCSRLWLRISGTMLSSGEKSGIEMANGSSCGRAWATNIFTRRTKILLFFGFCFRSEKYSWNSLLLLSFVQCPWHWRVLRRSSFFIHFIYNLISCTKQCLFSSLHSTVHSLQSAHDEAHYFEIVRDCDFVFQNVRKHVQHTSSILDLFGQCSLFGYLRRLLLCFSLIWNCYRLHLRRLVKPKRKKNTIFFVQISVEKYRQNDETVGSMGQHLSWVSRSFPFIHSYKTNELHCDRFQWKLTPNHSMCYANKFLHASISFRRALSFTRKQIPYKSQRTKLGVPIEW